MSANTQANQFNAPGSGTQMPSDVVNPTQVDEEPQQGSTMPGDGSHETQNNSGTGKLPFKDQVIGYAKKTRGMTLGKPDVKEHGEAILNGTATIDQPPQHNDNI